MVYSQCDAKLASTNIAFESNKNIELTIMLAFSNHQDNVWSIGVHIHIIYTYSISVYVYNVRIFIVASATAVTIILL